MASDPEVRRRILVALEKLGPIKVETLEEARTQFEMTDISITQFKEALNSLIYNPTYGQKIRCRRPRREEFWLSRPYSLQVVCCDQH